MKKENEIRIKIYGGYVIVLVISALLYNINVIYGLMFGIGGIAFVTYKSFRFGKLNGDKR